MKYFVALLMILTAACKENEAVQGPSNATAGPPGRDGIAGKNGITSLVRLDDVKDASICASGRGVVISTGLDTNGTNKLEDAEIKQVKVLCEPKCDCKTDDDDCDKKHDKDCDKKHEEHKPCNKRH